MTDQPPSSEQPTTAAARRRSRRTTDDPSSRLQSEASGLGPATDTPAQAGDDVQDIASELSFREAQTALELSLAELQAPDLDVEQMAGLFRRASCYAERCEQLLQRVQQEVMQWDPGQPENAPQPYQP